jgi:hypothetical protein
MGVVGESDETLSPLELRRKHETPKVCRVWGKNRRTWDKFIGFVCMFRIYYCLKLMMNMIWDSGPSTNTRRK